MKESLITGIVYPVVVLVIGFLAKAIIWENRRNIIKWCKAKCKNIATKCKNIKAKIVDCWNIEELKQQHKEELAKKDEEIEKQGLNVNNRNNAIEVFQWITKYINSNRPMEHLIWFLLFENHTLCIYYCFKNRYRIGIPIQGSDNIFVMHFTCEDGPRPEFAQDFYWTLVQNWNILDGYENRKHELKLAI